MSSGWCLSFLGSARRWGRSMEWFGLCSESQKHRHWTPRCHGPYLRPWGHSPHSRCCCGPATPPLPYSWACASRPPRASLCVYLNVGFFWPLQLTLSPMLQVGNAPWELPSNQWLKGVDVINTPCPRPEVGGRGTPGIWSLPSRLTLQSPTVVPAWQSPLYWLPSLDRSLPCSSTCIVFISVTHLPLNLVSGLLLGTSELEPLSLGPGYPDHWGVGVLEASEDLRFILLRPLEVNIKSRKKM